MLNRISVEQGLLLATGLCAASNGTPIALMPVAGSPLDMLGRVTVDFSQSQDYAQFITETVRDAQTEQDQEYADQISVDAILYHTNSADPVLGTIPHDQVMDELVAKLVPSLQHQLNHTRNVVKTKVTEIAEMVNSELSRRMDSALLNMQVKEVGTPVVFSNPTIVAEVEKYQNVPYNPDLANPIVLEPQTEAALREVIETGNDRLDADVHTWLASEEDGWLEKLFNDFFTPATSIKSPGNLHNFLRQSTTVYGRTLPNVDLCKVIGLFLLANGLYNNPIGKIDASLGDYNRFIGDLRDSLGALLNNERAEYYRAASEAQELVLYVEKNVIYVRAELYQVWLMDGGDIDVLYGNSIQQEPVITIPALNAAADKLRADWQRYIAIARAAEERNILTTTRNLFKRVLIDVINGLQEDEKRRAELIGRIWNDQLEKTSDQELTDIYAVTTKLVTRSMFPHTDAEYFLTSINEVCASNPDMDPREAATVATIDYMIDWALKQVQVRAV